VVAKSINNSIFFLKNGTITKCPVEFEKKISTIGLLEI